MMCNLSTTLCICLPEVTSLNAAIVAFELWQNSSIFIVDAAPKLVSVTAGAYPPEVPSSAGTGVMW